MQLPSEGFDDDQNYRAKQYENRQFVEPPIENVAVGIGIACKNPDESSALEVISGQQCNQQQFGMHPVGVAIVFPASGQQP